MSFDIDIIMVALFLAVTLIIGVRCGHGVQTMQDYALGGRRFSTATLSYTLIATWIGGGFFAISISQTYQDGVLYVAAWIGDIISLLVVSYFFSGRMQKFLGASSLAEVVGILYGKNVRVIAALASIAISVGAIALQLKVTSNLFNYFFNLSSIYALLVSSFVVIVYSTFGGIKSVTFTDKMQFLTFCIFVPIFALFIWNALGDHDIILQNLAASPIFDYEELANYQNPKFFPYLMLFIYSLLFTSLDPSLFQRALLAKDQKQIKQSFLIAAVVGGFVLLASCSIGAIIYGYDSNLDSDNLLMYIIDNYSSPGLKGCVLIGILAITMSTADSWINISSVIFANDFCRPLNIASNANSLFVSRYFSVFIGIFSAFLASGEDNLLELLLLIGNFFCPIVGPILFLGVLGVRSTENAALSAIFAGVVGTCVWRGVWQDSTGVDSVIPGSFTNLVVFLAVHFGYLKVQVSFKWWNRFVSSFTDFLKIILGPFIFFLKPQQEYCSAAENKINVLGSEGGVSSKKIEHYNMRIAQPEAIGVAEVAVQKILNSMIYDFRLPLGNSMNFVALMQNALDQFSEAQLTDLVTDVKKNNNNCSTRVLNILDFAALDVEKMNLQKQVINFSEMVENRVHECRRIYLDDKPIDFELSIEPEILISVAPNYIRQVIDNLAINSIIFSDEGVVSINVVRQGRYVIFLTEDQGIGIPKEDVYDIFTPFKMGSNTESKAQGRGVGLALCKSVAEAHGGSIMAKSKAKGAVFTMMLPC